MEKPACVKPKVVPFRHFPILSLDGLSLCATQLERPRTYIALFLNGNSEPPAPKARGSSGNLRTLINTPPRVDLATTGADVARPETRCAESPHHRKRTARTILFITTCVAMCTMLSLWCVAKGRTRHRRLLRQDPCGRPRQLLEDHSKAYAPWLLCVTDSSSTSRPHTLPHTIAIL